MPTKLSDRTIAWMEGVQDENEKLRRDNEELEKANQLLQLDNAELQSKVGAARDAAERIAGIGAGAELGKSLADEVSRSIDLKRAVEACLVNLGDGNTMGGAPASNVAAARRNLKEALDAWQKAV